MHIQKLKNNYFFMDFSNLKPQEEYFIFEMVKVREKERETLNGAGEFDGLF